MEKIHITSAYLDRLTNIDLYNYIAINYGDNFIPHLGERPSFKLLDLPTEELPDKLAYTVRDIAIIFDCGREKALKIMHLMCHFDCATKIGKDWYTSKDKIKEFLNVNMGQSIEI